MYGAYSIVKKKYIRISNFFNKISMQNLNLSNNNFKMTFTFNYFMLKIIKIECLQ